MIYSIGVCLVSFVALVVILRRDRVSLGLPIAYLFGLLLIHVPGALAHVVGGNFLTETELTETGIKFTAIGATCFVTGVALARTLTRASPVDAMGGSQKFWLFCLIGGWLVTYGLSFLGRIPTLGAAIEKGGAVWILGVGLGLRTALIRQDFVRSLLWIVALAVYPVIMLLIGGFLSFGSTSVFIVLTLLAVSARSRWRAFLGIAVATVLFFHLFLSYFESRNEIRDAVWGGADMGTRIEKSTNVLRDFKWFNPNDPAQLFALDQRLNQNYFVGLSAARIEAREVDYLHGRSLWEGLISIVPRVLWPEKPVYGGSPGIIREMTGFEMNDTTSFGVGNVMEFYINFGIPSLVGGFLVLGLALGWLDRKAASAVNSGYLGRSFLFFLPAAAMIQPNGSLVELTGGAAAGLLAAVFWKWIWERWFSSREMQTRVQVGVDADAASHSR